MSPKKLTAEDEQEIVRLYRQTDATSSTLAAQFQVSNSTIGRVLRANLSETEYESLIQQKRRQRSPLRSAAPSGVSLQISSIAPTDDPEAEASSIAPEKAAAGDSQLPDPEPQPEVEIQSHQKPSVRRNSPTAPADTSTPASPTAIASEEETAPPSETHSPEPAPIGANAGHSLPVPPSASDFDSGTPATAIASEEETAPPSETHSPEPAPIDASAGHSLQVPPSASDFDSGTPATAIASEEETAPPSETHSPEPAPIGASAGHSLPVPPSASDFDSGTPTTAIASEEETEPKTETRSPHQRRRRRRTTIADEGNASLPSEPAIAPEPEPEITKAETDPRGWTNPSIDEDFVEPDTDESGYSALSELLGEELSNDEEDDEEDFEEDWEETETPTPHSASPAEAAEVRVLPFSAAAFPKTCYIVVDKAGELVTRPLKEFQDLGNIPPQERQQTTLPVFDNHKVARRFSNRFQRAIKIPDGRLLQKTRSHLEAKGIARLLLDGCVYSLSSH